MRVGRRGSGHSLGGILDLKIGCVHRSVHAGDRRQGCPGRARGTERRPRYSVASGWDTLLLGSEFPVLDERHLE